ncbi:MAG: hypothetical protein ABSH14_05515 [Verrucomicrobiia bacterium]
MAGGGTRIDCLPDSHLLRRLQAVDFRKRKSAAGGGMIEYTIDAAQRLIRVRMSGANRPADLLQHFSNLTADPKFDATFNTLFRISEGATLQTTLFDDLLKTLLEQWQRRRKGVKWAVLSSSRIQLALAKLATDNVNFQFVQLRFFEDEDSAVKWLSSPTYLSKDNASGA